MKVEILITTNQTLLYIIANFFIHACNINFHDIVIKNDLQTLKIGLSVVIHHTEQRLLLWSGNGV